MAKYRTTPEVTDRMPGGVPYIIGNEIAERFSFYGMRAILIVFMTKYLLDSGGNPSPMDEVDASKWFHTFSSVVYITPLLGGLLADLFLGKYRTIIWLSVIYCLGHLALAIDNTSVGLAVGLGLIALGAGGIKPCVSSHVGDQFGVGNSRLLPQIFNWFYLSINLGAAASSLLIPKLMDWYGPHVAFGIPGVIMLVATVVFWAGRHQFAHIPPDRKGFVKDFKKPGVAPNLLKLCLIYCFVAMFWALFDQTASRWVLQGQNMDTEFLGIKWNPEQMQFINPVCILILVPLFVYVIYPKVGKIVKLTPLRKIAFGFFLASVAFVIPAVIESWIAQGETPTIWWQVLSYVVITAAEVLISITCLEFSYSQAPNRLKSLIMGLFYASVALGNAFTAAVNFFIKKEDGTIMLEGASYYWFFAGCMLVTAVFFLPVVYFYKEKNYIQGEDVDAPA